MKRFLEFKRGERVCRSLRIRMKKVSDRGAVDMLSIMVGLLIISVITALILPKIIPALMGGKQAAVREQVKGLIEVGHNYGAAYGGVFTGIGSYTAGGYVAGQTSLLPSNYTASGVSNPFNGFGVITSAATGSAGQFTVTESGLPGDVCTGLQSSFATVGIASCSSGTFSLTTQ